MGQELVVLCTVNNAGEANSIADALVTSKNAACVNIVPGIESVFRWEGEVRRESEVLLIIKTSAARYSDLEAQIKQLHSYTTPEVVALRIERGSSEYLHWVRESTSHD